MALVFSLSGFALSVNTLAQERTVYPDQAAAKKALMQTIKIEPKDVVPYFNCLIHTARNKRDNLGWHTPTIPKDSPTTVLTTVENRKPPLVVYPLTPRSLRVGKQSSWDLISEATLNQCKKFILP